MKDRLRDSTDPKVARRGRFAQRLRGIPRGSRQAERSLALLGSLRDLGWQASVSSRRPVDEEGRPVAWWTYPAIAWLEARLNKNDVVFEWGAGNSTLWLADRVEQVISVEDSEVWAEGVRRRAPGNVSILERRSSSEKYSTVTGTSDYVDGIREFPIKHFDLIVIDGRERNACCAIAPTYLKDDGLVLVDNADRPGSQPGLESLAEQGFLRADFVGFAPSNHYISCTSALFREPKRWFGGPFPTWHGY